MIRFEGDRQLPVAPADAWQKLRDARFLMQCVRGGTPSTEVPTQDLARCRVRPNVSFVHGMVEVTLRIVQAQEPTTLRVQVLGQGNNASCDVDTWLTLTEHQGGTHVHWTADVKSLGGVLKLAPAGQIQSAAQAVINDVWALLVQKIMK